MPAVITRTPEETGAGRVHLAVTVHKRKPPTLERRRLETEGPQAKGRRPLNHPNQRWSSLDVDSGSAIRGPNKTHQPV
jgi:hypothetical protein